MFCSPPGSAVYHLLEKGWTTTDYLLAHVVDSVRITNWQKTEGATKRPPRGMPDPFPRPVDNDKPKAQAGDTSSVGGVAATVTTLADFVAIREQRERQWVDKHRKSDEGGQS